MACALCLIVKTTFHFACDTVEIFQWLIVGERGEQRERGKSRAKKENEKKVFYFFSLWWGRGGGGPGVLVFDIVKPC